MVLKVKARSRPAPPPRHPQALDTAEHLKGPRKCGHRVGPRELPAPLDCP